MIVALGAIDGHPEKSLGGRLGHFARIIMKHVKISRAVCQSASRRSDDPAREDIPRGVRGNLVSNPIVIGPHRRRLKTARADEQQI